MDKKTAMEINHHGKEKFENRVESEKRTEKTRALDELYNGTCYVVKEGPDSYKLKHIPKASPKEKINHFQTGDRVKNPYGRLLTVLAQIENLVIVKEESNNYHPRDLTMIERAADTYQV